MNMRPDQDDLDAEIRGHLAIRIKERIESGAGPPPARLGHPIPDAQPLLERARKALDRCVQHRRNGEHTKAYNEAEVALRALRVLMRAEWDRAVRDLDSPVSSPWAVSYFTLPRHWELLDQMKNMKASMPVPLMTGEPFDFWAWLCGALLARSHARYGDAARIAGYCGEDDGLDRALGDFAEAYGDQTEADHAELVKAIKHGRVEAVMVEGE